LATNQFLSFLSAVEALPPTNLPSSGVVALNSSAAHSWLDFDRGGLMDLFPEFCPLIGPLTVRGSAPNSTHLSPRFRSRSIRPFVALNDFILRFPIVKEKSAFSSLRLPRSGCNLVSLSALLVLSSFFSLGHSLVLSQERFPRFHGLLSPQFPRNFTFLKRNLELIFCGQLVFEHMKRGTADPLDRCCHAFPSAIPPPPFSI